MTGINKVRKSDIIWNYVGTVFNMGMGFLMLPFLLNYLNEDILGIWYVMNSFSAIANLLTFGFTPAFARNIAYCWNGATELKQHGKEKSADSVGTVNYILLRKVIITSQYIYMIISVIAVGFLAIVGTVHINNIACHIMTEKIWISWIVFLAAIFLNMYYGCYSSFLLGIGQVKKSNQILVMASVIRILLMAILMGAGMGLLGAAIAYLAYGFCYRWFSKKLFYTEVKKNNLVEEHRIQEVSLLEVKECFLTIWYNAWRDGVVTVSAYLQTQMGTLICSCFLSLSETAMYSLTVQLIDVVGKVARAIYNAYTPKFQACFIRDDKEESRNSQAFCMFTFFLVYCTGILGLLLVGVPIVGWIKQDTILDRKIIIGYAIYQFMLSYRNCYGMYLSATNRVIYWKSYFLTGLACVAGYTLLFLLFDCGIWGIIFVSIITEATYNFWKWPSMVNRELDLKIQDIITLGLRKVKELFYAKGNE